ncbi:hypothetical protein [Oryza sativa Japonica Group]|uniref:Uncharacterized protein n=1 Tax=Oryza sativa subsp. japonica TaxID=39947 RepID=Q5VMP7_ORYSJ|nr:hypothetical protein [Oryza sativa Japonica Group]
MAAAAWAGGSRRRRELARAGDGDRAGRRQREQAARAAAGGDAGRLKQATAATQAVDGGDAGRRGLASQAWVRHGHVGLRSGMDSLDPLPSLIIDALVQYDGAKNISAAPFPVKAKSLM